MRMVRLITAVSALVPSALLALAVLTLTGGVSEAGGPIVVETETDDFQVNGFCTLRDAIQSANLDANAGGDCQQGDGTDTIMVPAGTYELDGFMIAGELELTEAVQIIGDGAEDTFIDGLDGVRIFQVDQGVQVTVDGVTLRNGYTNQLAGGGAIHNEGNLTIRNSVLEDNLSDGHHGGAINNSGGSTTLDIEDSILRRNRGDISGGAIASGGGPCAAMTLLRVTIERNSAWTYGGGINSCGTLTIQESVIRANLVEWAGGGIENLGDAIIRDSIISGNEVDGDIEQNGGGIRNAGVGTLLVERSLIETNSADHGGGISNAGEATIINSTLSRNSADGGSNFSSGDDNVSGSEHASLLNVTIVGDPPGMTSAQGLVFVADSGIGGPSGTVELTNTILAGDEDYNCVGEVTVVSHGYNIAGDDTCGLNTTGDQQNTNALLGPAQDNGGPTRTHALLAGSPALGAADQAACPDDDQRGEPRPQGDGCDVGAYESELVAPTPSPSPTPTASPTPTPTPSGEPTPTNGPTPTPGELQVVWADNNCSDMVDSVDALLGLRFDAGLPTDTGECPGLGDPVNVQNASVHPWGDVDCSNGVDAVDSLKVLRHDAGLSVTQPPDCPDLGDPVTISPD